MGRVYQADVCLECRALRAWLCDHDLNAFNWEDLMEEPPPLHSVHCLAGSDWPQANDAVRAVIRAVNESEAAVENRGIGERVLRAVS